MSGNIPFIQCGILKFLKWNHTVSTPSPPLLSILSSFQPRGTFPPLNNNLPFCSCRVIYIRFLWNENYEAHIFLFTASFSENKSLFHPLLVLDASASSTFFLSILTTDVGLVKMAFMLDWPRLKRNRMCTSCQWYLPHEDILLILTWYQ